MKYRIYSFPLCIVSPGSDEGGHPEDKANFVLLLKGLRAKFNEPGNSYLLTAAISAYTKKIDTAYIIPKIYKHLDYVHVMSYDYRGSWNKRTGHHSPLYASG